VTALRSISGRLVTRLTPRALRFRFHDAGILQRLAGRVPVDPANASAEAQERSQSRWRRARPQIDLTWGEELSGRPFVSKVAEHADLKEDTRVLEIGPGYGRLLTAYLDQGLPFSSYTGLDLSQFNVEHLGGRFVDPRISFFQGDVSSATIPPFDLGISSLTFKHFYPTFEAAVVNCASAMSEHGRLIFDLLEGKRTYFEHDDATYVHCYQPPEVQEIVDAAGLRVLAFDHVQHGPGPNQTRLLVVAGR
jgi:SAM-dependent methyltransferase